MSLSTTLIDKTFDPSELEARWYAHWEASGAFRPERPDARPYTTIIPPPNVTGSLHIGHALDNTLQDILIRYHRLLGRDARWVVGTDHAGIATQMVVERRLAEHGQPDRKTMGRARFLETVWDWKAESGDTITRQLRRLGASCDWANERFTMDDGFNTAVTKVFVQLFNEGLLYRDKRLVNWDPKLGTAISDLEVEYREIDGHMWHFRYPLEDGSGYLAVATTRPETILGDGAVAVNPDDPRYTHLIGQRCRLPLVDRLIPIIADGYVEADFGSGAVKITAAHDFNDFEVYKRHPDAGIPVINLMNPDATMSDACPPDYRGLTREEARRQVIADFDALGLLDKIEPHRHQVPYGDRSGVVIEPYLTDQWYVDAHTLAQPALEAVRSGATKFVPATWEKTYFNWLDNIQPWCVSRQLWWGHQIPAWYTPDGACIVAESEAEAQAKAPGVALRRDEDVLDTWFSSALWPFATLGWPENTPELSRHYPGDVLVTGFDIIFFWVARMMMQGIHFTEQPPFHTVYCHGLVRDAKGQKMSKSKGNTVDPLTLIDKYGADALRFTLAAMESQGRDIKLDEKRIEGYRNFATKLWNAARFAQSNGIGAYGTGANGIGGQGITPPAATHPVNRWIIGEVAQTVAALDAAMAAYRFDGFADTLYQFVWSRFCDWYLELTKPLLAEGADAALAEETRATAGWALDQILVMLHPAMPFLTEELWHKLGERPHDLILARWPDAASLPRDAAASAEIDWLIALISEVRSARTELNVPPSAKLGYSVDGASEETSARLAANATAIERLARIIPMEGAAGQGGRLQLIVNEATFTLPLEGIVDLAAERTRLEKAIAAAAKERDALAGRLASPGFTDKAKPEAVEKARADHAARTAEAERRGAALARLG
ncbi:valine--tRNA ligase [Polymorphobacter multimanifer]|uniref:valine--tRNA ligase n=1 Tax=Polymorphobacter multimanifer TaxID=1070431 RepID=UPI00166C825D|nr:valine--tRNA ligase [Polymorphobacter multimanifer]GGI89532.1 valine--tRNA ligase [Polymorphobacter multimanifer]